MSRTKENMVIAHHRDGRLLKGTTLDFFPTKPIFHITTVDSDIREVRVEDLKAIFFVKDLRGQRGYREKKGFFSNDNQGRKVMVEFFDGEVVFGYTLTYSPKGLGFFITPGDPGCNNKKIFIVHSAAKRVRIQAKAPSRTR